MEQTDYYSLVQMVAAYFCLPQDVFQEAILTESILAFTGRVHLTQNRTMQTMHDTFTSLVIKWATFITT